MGKPHPIELRKRVVARVKAGHTHCSTAAHFDVSIKFVNDMVKLMGETNSLEPKRQGNPKACHKLAPHEEWVRTKARKKGGCTLDDLVALLAKELNVHVHRSSVWRFLRHINWTNKQVTERASEQVERPDVVEKRHNWIVDRQPFMAQMVENLAFLDETCITTNMGPRRGWEECGKRRIEHAPAGRRCTQTFVAVLRHDRLDVPCVIDRPMNTRIFETYCKTSLGPTLEEGDFVVLDNLSSHKSQRAAEILEARGARFLFLPPYSPDLNPIEMAFSKLKALLRRAAARTYEDLWKAVGQVCDLFSEEECYNFIQAAGYKSN